MTWDLVTYPRICVCTMTNGKQGTPAMPSGLKPKQQARLALVPPKERAALRAHFIAQNSQKAMPRKVPPVRQMRRSQGLPNFLDPMSPVAPPTAISSGKALPHNGLVSGDFVVGSTNTTVLVCTNTGDSGTVGVLWNVSPAGEYVDGETVFTIPTLALADNEGGASAVRASKLSVTVVNCTNTLKRGGRVTYLNSSQRLPERKTNAALRYAAIIEGVKSSPYRRRITGDQLSHPQQLIGYPVDATRYEEFTPHNGTLTADEFAPYLFRASLTDPAPKTRPMSTVVYIFDPVTDPQDYSVTIRASYYTRWPITTVPGQSMTMMPTADPKAINHVRDHAESTANDLVHVAEGGALAMAAPRAAEGLRALGSTVMSRIGGALTRGVVAAEGLAVDALGPGGVALAEAAAPLLV